MNVKKTTTRIASDKKKKNNGKKWRGLFAEAYTVAPAPSRDYYALQLFQKKLFWTRWKISHGPYSAPVQKVVALEEFKKDVTLQHELTYIFGTDTTNLINDLAYEKWSLVTMPSIVLQKILSLLSVSDILRLSQVCKRLSKECSSNELWKSICKKQWKILIHNDIEKANLMGWKTIYLEKMRPKRHKTDHQPKPNLSLRNRFNAVSTLNSPDSRKSVTKSNLTIPKRTQESKQWDTVRSTSAIYGKDFKTMSMGTGKSTERMYAVNKGKSEAGNFEQRPRTVGKLGSRKVFHPPSHLSTINLSVPTEKQKQSELHRLESNGISKSKVTSIRVRSATSHFVQPTLEPSGKSRSDRSRPSTGKTLVKKALK